MLTWPLIPFGAYVRLKNAGLSCPDWPLCYGQLIPPSGYEIWLEVGHRFIAFILGILIIGITFLTFWSKSYHQYRRLAVFILILVCFQGIIGGLTVTMTLWPPIVTLHLLVGNILFGLLVYLARKVFDNKNDKYKVIDKDDIDLGKSKKKTILFKLKLMTLIFFLILISGGYNSSTYSGSYCEAFPGCHEGSMFSFGLSGKDVSFFTGVEGHFLPEVPKEFQGRFLPEYKKEWINMIHRFIAIFGGALLIIISWFWLDKKYGYSFLGKSIVFLLFFEIFLGIFNVLFRVHVLISSMHTAVAATLVGLLFLAIAEVSINGSKK